MSDLRRFERVPEFGELVIVFGDDGPRHYLDGELVLAGDTLKLYVPPITARQRSVAVRYTPTGPERVPVLRFKNGDEREAQREDRFAWPT